MTRYLLGLDLVAVLGFVVIGRENHERGLTLGGILATAAPFLIGVAAGWLTTRAWRRPLAISTGIGIVVTTVVVGMLLRRVVFDDGTAVTFVAVAAAVLTLFIVGWRLLPHAYNRYANSR